MNDKILVVEDELTFMEMMVRHLKKRGYSVVGSSDPIEALEIFKKEGDFKVIVTDWSMPEMDGNQLIMAAQAIDPKVQAIIISTFESEVKGKSEQPGWGNFINLNKPLDRMSDLSYAVKMALEFRSMAFPD